MQRITFDPAALEGDKKKWWEEWLASAKAKKAELIEAWETRNDPKAGKKPRDPEKEFELKFDAAMWTELKQRIHDDVFNGKCAYCEARKPARWPIDMDHYRPKGAVTHRVEGEKGLKRPSVTNERGELIDHPGYFWLAYEWRNLLPCCKRCNSGRGKNSQFPVGATHVFAGPFDPAELNKLSADSIVSTRYAGYAYLSLDDLDAREQPRLLHPYRDDPVQHIGFGVRGIEFERTEAGKRTIEAMDLADDELRRDRQGAQELAFTAMLALAIGKQQALAKPLEDSMKEASDEFLAAAPRREYSRAVAEALPSMWDAVSPFKKNGSN